MYYDHKSKSWLVGRVTECQHSRTYLIETESGTMVSHNRCDIHPSSLTFTPLPKIGVKLMPYNGIVSNPGSVPVSGKVVKPVKLANANTSGPTDRHPVAKSSSGTTVGAKQDQVAWSRSLTGLTCNSFTLFSQGRKCSIACIVLMLVRSVKLVLVNQS